ncbi:hypothetical protein NYE37_13805 [Thermoactinomyces sp. FSL K6-2592]|jgi:hypothetical protein|uniref:hypothetical protein n=1 Tax=Thermoactinomyces sp. FSL K6-2592 TaxID=2975347 RepID=UPI0030F836B7
MTYTYEKEKAVEFLEEQAGVEIRRVEDSALHLFEAKNERKDLTQEISAEVDRSDEMSR